MLDVLLGELVASKKRIDQEGFAYIAFALQESSIFTIFVFDVLEVIESWAQQDHELVVSSGRIVDLLYHDFPLFEDIVVLGLSEDSCMLSVPFF